MNKGPVIKDFGAVFDVASPDYKTPIDADYKVLFNVHQAATSPSDVNEGLDTVARFLNMHAAAGVPRARMQVAVVLHGRAGKDTLRNEAYKAARSGLPKSDIAPAIKLALSAMTVMATLQQQRGYTIMP